MMRYDAMRSDTIDQIRPDEARTIQRRGPAAADGSVARDCGRAAAVRDGRWKEAELGVSIAQLDSHAAGRGGRGAGTAGLSQAEPFGPLGVRGGAVSGKSNFDPPDQILFLPGSEQGASRGLGAG